MNSMDKKVQKKVKGIVPPNPPVINPSGQPQIPEPTPPSKPNEPARKTEG